MLPNEKPLVLVTGSSGLIGERFSNRHGGKYQIIGADIKPPEHGDGGDFIECDLTDEGGAAAAVDEIRRKHGERIAAVIHLAAYYDFSGEPSPLYEELTINGTRRLLRALAGMQVDQFQFASTLLAMAPAEPGERLTEASPVQGEWDYPQSKLAAEKVIKEERGAIPAVIHRVAGVYDEGCHSLPIAQQIKRIYERQMESHVYPGNVDHGQAFVHLDDAVDSFHRAIERRAELASHELFLIAEEDVMSYGELQDAIGKLLHGEEWTTMRVPKAVARAGAWAQEKMASSEEEEPFIKPWMIDLADQHYPVDNSRAAERLNWRPRHTLRHTLPAMIELLKRDPEAWYAENGLHLPKEMKHESAAPKSR